jgi:hypothetical protein
MPKLLIMKMNAGAWIGLIGGLIGILVAIGAVLATAGSAGIYITAGIIVVFGGMMFLFYKLFFGPMINASRLAKVGISGKATIREVRDTGVTINNSPQVKLVLDVKNSFGQVYSVTIRALVSRINPGMFQPGMVVPVKIDPKNDQNVVIDYDSGNATTSTTGNRANTYGAAQVTALQDDMMKLQKDQETIRLTGKSARAIVKKYTWLGIYVNGNNPYAEIVVEVLPDDGPAFEGSSKAAIGEQSVTKYQPGEEIFVKYDPLNRSIALDHS